MSLDIFTAACCLLLSPPASVSEKMSLTRLLWSEALETRYLSIARLWFLPLFLVFMFVDNQRLGERASSLCEGLITRVSSDYHLPGYSLSPLTWRSESNKSSSWTTPTPNCQPPILMSLTLDRTEIPAEAFLQPTLVSRELGYQQETDKSLLWADSRSLTNQAGLQIPVQAPQNPCYYILLGEKGG